MTITANQVEATLRTAWPDAALDGPPQRITGGEWAAIYRLRATHLPDGIPGDLVLRIAPHPEMAAKEQAVQAIAADSGVPTPRLHLTGPSGGPLPGAWAVMDLAPGTPLLTNLNGLSALAHLPQILRRLPHQLADTMAAVHRLDPGAVLERARAAAPTVALTIEELWPHLEAGVRAAARPELTAALDRLAETRPPQDAAVVCHGDLHPLNLLADGRQLTVVDWTGAIVAPAAFDVAFTALLLGNPPLPTPPALRPALGVAGGVLARRFTRLYRRANPTADLTHLAWYEALHAVRILTDHATWTNTGDPRAHHHPWRLLAPGAAQALSRATGAGSAPR